MAVSPVANLIYWWDVRETADLKRRSYEVSEESRFSQWRVVIARGSCERISKFRHLIVPECNLGAVMLDWVEWRTQANLLVKWLWVHRGRELKLLHSGLWRSRLKRVVIPVAHPSHVASANSTARCSYRHLFPSSRWVDCWWRADGPSCSLLARPLWGVCVDELTNCSLKLWLFVRASRVAVVSQRLSSQMIFSS